MPAIAYHPTRDGRVNLAKRKINSKLAEQLRQAIRETGWSLNELARRSGVDEGALSRFLRTERTLPLTVASRVCDALSLELCKKSASAKPRPRKETHP